MRVFTIVQQWLGFTRSEILTILFLSGSLLAGVLVRWFDLPQDTRGAPPHFPYAQSDSEYAARNLEEPFVDTPRAGTPRAKKEPGPGSVNVNSAPRERLLDLPGIGPSYADRIIEYRTRHGPFRHVEDLAMVKGIGTKRLEKLRPFVTIE